ncbi:MAG: lytic transglycosylase domain-containing protein [Flavobacteriales bacterium]
MNSALKYAIVPASSAIVAVALFITFGNARAVDNNVPVRRNPAEEGYRLHIQDNYKVFTLPTPESLTFGGADVPLKSFGVREKLDRELLVNTYWHSNTLLMFKRSNRWFPVIEPILERNGIPDDFKYLAVIESGLTNAVSPAGATGFWQFLKSTGESYGLQINEEVDERYHVEKSTEAACKYLNDAYAKFGDWALVAASYNMGMGGVSKQLNRQKVNSYWDLLLNEETSRYVYRILAIKEILNNGTAYGFVVRPGDLYDPYETREVTLEGGVDDLADFALQEGANYNILKTLNPWLRQSYLKNPSKKSYTLELPA